MVDTGWLSKWAFQNNALSADEVGRSAMEDRYITRQKLATALMGYLGAAAVVVPNDASAAMISFAESLSDEGHSIYVCDGTEDDKELQDSITAIESVGGGRVLWLPGNYAVSDATNTDKGLLITPNDLSNSMIIDAYGASLTYSGSGEAFKVLTNLAAGPTAHFWKNVRIGGLKLAGSGSASHGIYIEDCNFLRIFDIYMTGFSGSGAKGISVVATAGKWTEYLSLENIQVVETVIPLEFYAADSYFNNTNCYNLLLAQTTPSEGGGCFAVAGSYAPERGNFVGIICKPGENGVGFDFGSADWHETTFINPAVEIVYPGCTAFKHTGAVPPLLITQGKEKISGAAAVELSGTMLDRYDTVYRSLFQCPHFADATLLLPFLTAASGTTPAATRDHSGQQNHATLVNGATWQSKRGRLGALDLDGTDQYLTTPALSLDGDFTILLHFKPDYDYDDSALHYFFNWQVDASNFVLFQKAAANNLWVACQGSGNELNVGPTPSWSAGDDLFYAITIDESGQLLTLYENGVQLAQDNTTGGSNYDQSSTEAIMYIGSSVTPSNYNDGKTSFYAIIPRCMSYTEVRDVTQLLMDLMETGQTIGSRVVDARAANTPNSGDANTDGLIDALRDAMITHGLISSS